MTIGRHQQPVPARDDEEHPGDVRRPSQRASHNPQAPEEVNETFQREPPAQFADERHDERHGQLRLAGQILSSWAYTARLLTVTVILLGIIIAGVWLLNADIAQLGGEFDVVRTVAEICAAQWLYRRNPGKPQV